MLFTPFPFKTKKIPEHLIIHHSTWHRPKRKGRWIFWLLGPLFCFGIVIFAVQALAEEFDELGSGELLFQSAKGEYKAALHVESKVDIDISGVVANVTFKQIFTNQTDEWQNAVYVFPLSETAAINYMQLQIGERIIKAEIKEKKAAKKIYETAKLAGKKTALVEQARPNLFIQHVSNLAPGEDVTVELRFIQQVEYDAGDFELRFPTTITERYSPNSSLNTEPSVSQPTNPEGPNLITIDVKLNAGLKLKEISSPYHEIKIKKTNSNHHVSLKKTKALMDRDFVLQWRPTNSNKPQTAIFSEKIEGEDYALLMIVPPNITTSSDSLARDIIFVIDTSGSMQGQSIKQAKQSLLSAVQRLRPRDRFNIIEFNSRHTQMFSESEDGSQKNKLAASNWISRLTAGGGTEMLPALRTALSTQLHDNYLKQIIFVTDGAVGNEAQLFSLIHSELKTSKLFTVGIGSAPNSYFMRKAAQFGGGIFTHIGDVSEVVSKMDNLYSKLDNPLVRDIKVTWRNEAINHGIESYPKVLPPLYLNEPLMIVAKGGALSGKIEIEGNTSSDIWKQTLRLNTGHSHSGIATLWARAKIESLEDEKIAGRSAIEVKQAITDIALRHHLVSRHTSLIAVDKKISKPQAGISNVTSLKTSQLANHTPQGQGLKKMMYPKTASNADLTWWIGLLCLIFGLTLVQNIKDEA
ncbi:MAG: Ca-activated chloride channel family protein [Candidatus Azotimanducaceae bacterium]|jgi:Ca-activated chloride channel family protein